jgi:hypothetical protein
MAKQTLYMGTTRIDAQKTAGEIISELVKAGATSINTDYKNGTICGLRWVMVVNGHNALFDMPVRVDAVAKLIRNREKAVRVAWRQLLRWTQAQVAMIQTGMVQPAEVFFAYHVPAGQTGPERTVFEMAISSQFKALTPASKQ